METSDVLLRGACQLTCSALVGTAGAALCGLNPLIGAGIAAIAFLATAVALQALLAIEAMARYDSLDGNGCLLGTHKVVGALAMAASFCASVAQISQIFAQYAGFATPFLPVFGLASVSVISGLFLGDGIYHQLAGNVTEA